MSVDSKEIGEITSLEKTFHTGYKAREGADPMVLRVIVPFSQRNQSVDSVGIRGSGPAKVEREGQCLKEVKQAVEGRGKKSKW